MRIQSTVNAAHALSQILAKMHLGELDEAQTIKAMANNVSALSLAELIANAFNRG
jgi:hypothetical protein